MSPGCGGHERFDEGIQVVCRIRLEKEQVLTVSFAAHQDVLGVFPALVADGTRQRVLDRMRDLGFTYVTVDLAGYRTGALNEALQET